MDEAEGAAASAEAEGAATSAEGVGGAAVAEGGPASAEAEGGPASAEGGEGGPASALSRAVVATSSRLLGATMYPFHRIHADRALESAWSTSGSSPAAKNRRMQVTTTSTASAVALATDAPSMGRQRPCVRRAPMRCW